MNSTRSFWLQSITAWRLEFGFVQAEIRTGFEELYRVMSQREEFRWMMLRIKRMAEPWVSAIRSLAAKQNLTKRRRKKVSILCAVGSQKAGTCRGGLHAVFQVSFWWHFAAESGHSRSQFLYLYLVHFVLCCSTRVNFNTDLKAKKLNLQINFFMFNIKI